MKYEIKIDEQVFGVEIVDLHARPVLVLVDGECFEVWPEGQVLPAFKTASQPTHASSGPARPVASSGLAPQADGNSDPDQIKAPIPGVILSIAIHPGDLVQKGQELCILEAMKMKNLIRSPREGAIAAIHVASGQSVNHGELLMEYEPKKLGDR